MQIEQSKFLKQNNHPGMHINNDLKEAEKEHKEHKELSDKKYGLYFIIFQGIIYLFAIVSFGFGHPEQLGKPYDSSQQVCGVDVGLEAYKYIYFANPTNDKYLTRTLCVKECPTSKPEMDSDESLQLECFPNLLISSCRNRPSIDDPEYAMLYYDTVPFIDVCLPKKINYFQNILPALETTGIVSFLSDISNGKTIIFATLALCLFLNQIFYLMLIKLQQMSVWIISIASIVGLFLSGILGLSYFLDMKQFQDMPNTQNLSNEQAVGIIQAKESSSTLILLTSLTFLIMGLYFLIDLIVRRQTYKTIGFKIKLVNYFFDFSSSGLQQEQDKPSRFREILILLLGSSFAFLFFCGLWVWMAVNLFSIGQKVQNQYAFNTFQLSWITFILGFFHIFELIIVTLTILGTEMLLLIGKIVEVYKISGIQRHKLQGLENQDEKTITDILEIYSQNNIGSVIFGELYILILKIPRLFVKLYIFIRQKINQNYEISEKLQKILQINSRAYLLAYLRNDDFVQSCESQYIFDEELKNKWQTQYHGEQFTTNYCFAISNICVSLTYVLIITTKMTIGVHQPVYLLAISFLFSYFISAMFSTIYGATIDNLTILLYRDAGVDGKTIGTCVGRAIRLMKEHILDDKADLSQQNTGQE